MRVTETLHAWGHPHITGSHRTTFEITRAQTVSPSGDCVIAVAASKGALGLSSAFKRIARNDQTQITVLLEADELQEQVVGWGHPALTFTHPEDLVARTSRFTCPRTLMIRADKAARNLSRELIRCLQNPQQRIVLTLIADRSY
jgi:hypothetical protein